MYRAFGRYVVPALIAAAFGGCSNPAGDQKEVARRYVQAHIDRLLGGDKTARPVVGFDAAISYVGGVESATIESVTEKYRENGERWPDVFSVRVKSRGRKGLAADSPPVEFIGDLWIEVKDGTVTTLNERLPAGSY